MVFFNHIFLSGPSCSKGGLYYPPDKSLSGGYHNILLVSLTLICWIVIYLVDSAIQLLNKWGVFAYFKLVKHLASCFCKAVASTILVVGAQNYTADK